MKMSLGDFNARVGQGDIFKLTIGKESLHKITNDNGVKLVNFTTPKSSLSKVHRFHTGIYINKLGILQMG